MSVVGKVIGGIVKKTPDSIQAPKAMAELFDSGALRTAKRGLFGRKRPVADNVGKILDKLA